MENTITKLINTYKNDPECVYHTWFINNDDRLKAFRTIKKGVADVIKEVKAGTFGNDFKNSSLELVLNCITEQKQIFKGAAHAFYWKPRLRIPDIYENEQHKLIFAQFLSNCLNATTEKQLIKEIILLDQHKIKGLGPAVASILYFLHPTILPPCNTAIVRGFNLLFNEKIKLGSWTEYLKMREIVLAENKRYKSNLSNDLGCFCGLLFDIGDSKLLVNTKAISLDERLKIDKKIQKRHKEVLNEGQEQNLHTEMQYHILTVGNAVGYDVIAAVNDLSRCHQGQSLSFIGLNKFPTLAVNTETYKTITLIDAVWFEKGTNKVACAFEVEKSTSIYSGILRLSDLYHSFPDDPPSLYLIIPDKREKEVIAQLTRPSFTHNKISISYILFSNLKEYCDAMCKFGENKAILQKIAKNIDN